MNLLVNLIAFYLLSPARWTHT